MLVEGSTISSCSRCKKSSPRLIEVIVYLKEDYSVNKSIWVDANLSKDEITEIVNKKFNTWYYYDIE